MNWTGNYIIDDVGWCRWIEGLKIQDSEMIAAYRENKIIAATMEFFASVGVVTGQA